MDAVWFPYVKKASEVLRFEWLIVCFSLAEVDSRILVSCQDPVLTDAT